MQIVARWNRALAAGRGYLWSPTIRAAVLAGTPWLDVYCPGCRTARALDIHTLDRPPLASVGSLVLSSLDSLIGSNCAEGSGSRSSVIPVTFSNAALGHSASRWGSSIDSCRAVLITNFPNEFLMWGYHGRYGDSRSARSCAGGTGCARFKVPRRRDDRRSSGDCPLPRNGSPGRLASGNARRSVTEG